MTRDLFAIAKFFLFRLTHSNMQYCLASVCVSVGLVCIAYIELRRFNNHNDEPDVE